MARNRRMVPCPHCGELFREGRLSCPHCGADAQTGWLSEEDQDLASVDLNFTKLDDDDYDMFIQSEGMSPGSSDQVPRERQRGPVAAIVTPLPALVLLLLLVAAAVAMKCL